ncbi:MULTISPECIES: substrate-binding domain-containing protein [Methylocaldum]|jgi:ABC-type phosphate transport system substrate-binding protein|uniref:substrate-binding domain-containing protein n=1 Tax=unclassified Methylocaldum TaxID=2622260 RepID=UPI001F0A9B6D|nr:substrate-binding domain-containing protein [Methylocaldum sp. 14B]
MMSKSTGNLHRLIGCGWVSFLLSLALAVIVALGCAGKPVMAGEPSPKIYAAEGRADSLSADTLREIFFMRLTSWPDGTPIRVFVLPDKHPLHVRFSKEVLGVYPFQLRAAWDRLVFSGTGLIPHMVETVGEMREMVRATPGGIGYVDK